jgi:hypothetical protein
MNFIDFDRGQNNKRKDNSLIFRFFTILFQNNPKKITFAELIFEV